MKHLRYLSYLAKHKWFVLVACWKRGLYIQGLVHDWTKFFPSEWCPYASFFYTARGEREPFDIAWLKHQHRSPHHWQHWVLRNDDGSTRAIQMPRKYMLEMVCDWDGAGRAITGKAGGTAGWYLKNRDKMLLNPETRVEVEKQLGI